MQPIPRGLLFPDQYVHSGLPKASPRPNRWTVAPIEKSDVAAAAD